jgi:hypothetical protein
MANEGNNSNSVAIVALIIIGALIAGAVFLYARGDFGPPQVIERDTKIIEREAPPPPQEEEVEPPAEEPGFEFRHEDEEGNSTEIEAPAP